MSREWVATWAGWLGHLEATETHRQARINARVRAYAADREYQRQLHACGAQCVPYEAVAVSPDATCVCAGALEL